MMLNRSQFCSNRLNAARVLLSSNECVAQGLCSPLNVPDDVTKNAFIGTVRCCIKGNRLDAPRTPKTPTPKPPRPPRIPPLTVALEIRQNPSIEREIECARPIVRILFFFGEDLHVVLETRKLEVVLTVLELRPIEVA